jgi:hypothetical protein
VQDAGADAGGGLGCLSVQDGADDIAVVASTFSNCGVAGVGAEMPFDTFTGNTIASSTVGLSVVADVLGSLTEAVTYNDVTRNVIVDVAVTRTATWVDQGIPWHIAADLRVEGPNSPVLTLAAGTDLRFTPDRAFRIGSNDEGGLITAGTVANPVRLSAIDQAADGGEWVGLVFDANTLSGSSLTNLVIESAGADAAGGLGSLTVHAAGRNHISVQGLTLDRCGLAGIGVDDEDAQFLAFSDVTISNAPTGLALDANVIGSIAEPVTTINVLNHRMPSTSLRQSATWQAQSLPWIMQGGTLFISGDVGVPAVLTMTGGEYRFNSSQTVRIGNPGPGGIVASGAVFASTDVNSTSGGDWVGFTFGTETVTSSLTNVTIKQAGQDTAGGLGAITLDRSGGALTITNPIFEHNSQADVFVDCQSTPVITGAGAATFVFEPNCG